MNESCYFVTGAAGFVGRHLCRHLRAAEHRVRGLARRPDAALEEMGVEVISGDLNRSEPWQHALVGTDFIVHCAAWAAFGNGPGHLASVAATRHLIAAAQQPGVALRRFVYVSSIGAVDRAPGDPCREPLADESPLRPTSDYGRAKRAAEQLVRDSGLPFCIVRPAMVVGPDMRHHSHFAVFVRMALRGAPLARFAWPGSLSVVHVDDLAAALDLAATHPAAGGRTFFCAGTPLSVRECFSLACPSRRRLPLAWLAHAAGLFPAAVPFRLKALLLPALTAADAPLRELGWQPRQTARDALQEVIARETAKCNPECDPGGQTVITGAASGLGRALVHRLADRRRHLLLVDRDRAGLERCREQFPHCRIAVVDFADAANLAGLLAGADWRAHPVRELFACAGIGWRGPVLARAVADHARLFEVNLLARLRLAHAVLPAMIRSQFGRIVLISSSSAFQPLPYMATYAAANVALLYLGEAWAAEIAGTGVHMMQVCPGGMQTNFQASSGVKELPGEKLMDPAEVADEIMRALAKEKPTAIISARAWGMSLAGRVLPRSLSVALWERLMAHLR